MVASAENRPKISVVMATYNRAETLRETLRHLAEQDLDPAEYEVIVVDDGSSDHTRSVVEEWVPRARFALSYLHHSNQGPGYTQNRGLEVARAPIAMLMADDIFMSAQAVAAHLRMHEANPEPEVAVLGRVEQPAALRDSVFARTWDPFRFKDFAGMREMPYYRFWANNMSAKRDFLLRHGPFREQRGRAGAAAHEDPELGYQLSRFGLRILYCPEALGFHHHPAVLENECRVGYIRGLNFGPFRERVGRPEIAVAYHVWDISTVGDHLRTWFGPGRPYVAPADRNPVLLLRYLLRGLAFNSLTIPLIWKPLLERAERDPRLARLMRASFYRGVIAYNFFRGYREGKRWSELPAPQVQHRGSWWRPVLR